MKHLFVIFCLITTLSGCGSAECPENELMLSHYEYSELSDGSAIATPVYYCGQKPDTEPEKIHYYLPRY